MKESEYYCDECPAKDTCADAYNCHEGFYGICPELYADQVETKGADNGACTVIYR